MSDYLSDLSGLSASRTYSGSSAGSSKSSDNLSIDMSDFLSMMVAQFQNQDPENAASTTDMLNQMVQMSMIQAITNITDATTMMYTSSLVGKEVTVGQYDSNGKLQEIVGTVTGTGTYDNKPVVFVNGVSYNVSSIMAVGRLPDKGSTTDGGSAADDNPPADGSSNDTAPV